MMMMMVFEWCMLYMIIYTMLVIDLSHYYDSHWFLILLFADDQWVPENLDDGHLDYYFYLLAGNNDGDDEDDEDNVTLHIIAVMRS